MQWEGKKHRANKDWLQQLISDKWKSAGFTDWIEGMYYRYVAVWFSAHSTLWFFANYSERRFLLGELEHVSFFLASGEVRANKMQKVPGGVSHRSIDLCTCWRQRELEMCRQL